MYTINTYTNNTHKKMYQNSYTNIPEQYINIIKNGPDENTVIRGKNTDGVHLEIWIKPRVIIGMTSTQPQEIYLVDRAQLRIPKTKITNDFGSKWLTTFSNLFPDWFKK